MVQAKDPPSHYLTKLRTYLDPKASRSHRVSVLCFVFISVARSSGFNSIRGPRKQISHEKFTTGDVGHDINLHSLARSHASRCSSELYCCRISFLSDRNLKRCVIPSFTLNCDRTIVKRNFGSRQSKSLMNVARQ